MDFDLFQKMNSKSIKRHLSSANFSNSVPTAVTDRPRRLSIQENFAQLSRSFSSLRLTPSKSSGEGWDLFGVIIDKEVLENILANHYEDPSIKVFVFVFLQIFFDVIFIFLDHKACHWKSSQPWRKGLQGNSWTFH